MEDFKLIKCPSCGSSIVEIGENLTQCCHCGSLLEQPAKFNGKKLLNTMYLIIVLLVFIGMGVFWQSTQEVKNGDKSRPTKHNEIKIPAYTVPITSIPKLDTTAVAITNQEVKAYQKKVQNPQLEISHIEKGKLRNGGFFWIITVLNNNPYLVYNPGLIMSLFDEQNKRVDELRVWSKQKTLEPDSQAVVLVNLSKPPLVKFHTKIKGTAKANSLYVIPNEEIDVQDYLVKKTDDKWVEIIGDVYNPHDFQVDFVEIIAIAKDESGKSIGIGWTYASTSSMPAQSTSGFKIKAGAFLINQASSWSVRAIGRKHKK